MRLDYQPLKKSSEHGESGCINKKLDWCSLMRKFWGLSRPRRKLTSWFDLIGYTLKNSDRCVGFLSYELVSRHTLGLAPLLCFKKYWRVLKIHRFFGQKSLKNGFLDTYFCVFRPEGGRIREKVPGHKNVLSREGLNGGLRLASSFLSPEKYTKIEKVSFFRQKSILAKTNCTLD